MMRFKSFLLILLICIIFSLNFVVANDNVNITSEVAFSDSNVEEIDLSSDIESIDNSLDSISKEDNLCSVETSKTIYVGHHNISDGGNGSKDNPFTTFKSACEDVNGEDNVTIYVFGGEYKLGEGMTSGLITGAAYPLIFNTSNLNIVGINGSVIIKNFNTVKKNGFAEAFSLTTTSGNFSFSNLIFDATDAVSIFLDENDPYAKKTTYFLPFFGQANLGIYNNCSFKAFGTSRIAQTLSYNSEFNNCYIEATKNELFMTISANTSSSFKNCIFTIPQLSFYYYLPCNISMNNVWFGVNNLPSYLRPDRTQVIGEDGLVDNWGILVTRYAIFNVTQNYLGNDEYEIIGKLTWNGTEDQDGMENFQPMTVTLLSENGGEFANSTVTLVNGTFKTIYKNSASNHIITATLHNQDIDLKFSTVNITAKPVSIYYGEDQNITVTFSQVINSTVSISINNKPYDVKVNDSDSFTYTINDILKEGTYTVNITLNDDKAGVYGKNSTTFTVSKNDLSFDPNIPSNCKVGDDVKITVELPTDATGKVIVTVNGDTNFTETASANVEITINGLVAGDNKVTVIYSGDDKYLNKSVDGIITAEKVPINVTNNTIVIDSPTNSNTPSVSINLTSDATGNLTVTVKDKNYTQELVNGSATVTITDLASGTYNAVVTYSGDGKYDSITKNVTLAVNAIKTSIVAPAVTTTYSVAKKLVVTLKDANGKALSGKKVTVKVGSISKTLTTNGNGQVSVDISSLVPKTYSATIKFAGDDKYAQSTATAKVVVNKAKSKITAKKATFKAKKKTKKYTITLKAGKKAISKVKVTLKVKGKTYKATTNAKGKATFKITKLTKKGKHNAVIKFKGNKYYKASSKKVKLTVKK